MGPDDELIDRLTHARWPLLGRLRCIILERVCNYRQVRDHARGTERFGLVAFSKVMRLKPHAIDIRVSVDPVHYFLNDAEDTRSSFYLEDADTEFQVQGLELDWVCVTWDGDFRFDGSGWNFHDFRGDRWLNIANADNRIYLRNAYRVLLIRARQGMVIFVPPGDQRDPTLHYEGCAQKLHPAVRLRGIMRLGLRRRRRRRHTAFYQQLKERMRLCLWKLDRVYVYDFFAFYKEVIDIDSILPYAALAALARNFVMCECFPDHGNMSLWAKSTYMLIGDSFG